MNKKNISISTILFGIIVITFVFYMCLTFKPYEKEINSYYQVYLSGEKIGLTTNKEELYNLIDLEQESIKNKYNVDKVYPPAGLEVQKVLTYKTNVMSAREIYNEIKDIEPFTIEGYEVTVTNEKKKEKFYILNKEDLDISVRNTVLAFIDEEDYDNYLNGVKKEIIDEGTEITDVYFDREVKIKKSYISTEENIITNSDDLNMFFLFGKTELTDKYVVKASDTIESIAEKNKFGVSDFLIANPDIVSEKALLAVGQEVSVAAISPIANIVVESFQTELQTVTYDTKIEYDKNLSASTSYVKQEGKNGLSKVKYSTQEMNGVILNTALVNEEVIRQPQDKIVVLGAKNVVYYGNSTYWAWPTSKPFRISDNYGWRICPFHGREFHGALDITGTSSRDIYAIQSGTVVLAQKSGYNTGKGKNVTIRHENGYESMYWHLNSVRVSEGDKVEKGQVIGVMGMTGSATGVHLDFRIKKNGEYMNPFDLYK